MAVDKSDRSETAAKLILPPVVEGWQVSDTEMKVLLDEIELYVANAIPIDGHARCLTYLEQFRLQRIIEYILVCGRECEGLMQWKLGLEKQSCAWGRRLYGSYKAKTLEELAYEVGEFIKSVESLGRAVGALDAAYTSKTEFRGTRDIAYNAMGDPLEEELGQLVEDVRAQIVQWEVAGLKQGPLDNPVMLKHIQTLNLFISRLGFGFKEYMDEDVKACVTTLIEYLTLRPEPARDMLASINSLRKWYDVAYLAEAFKPTKSLFEKKLKEMLFNEKETCWLNAPEKRETHLDLGETIRITTDTWFEWTFLNDRESWASINAIDQRGCYLDETMSKWQVFATNGTEAVIQQSSADMLIGNLLNWYEILETADSDIRCNRKRYIKDALQAGLRGHTPLISQELVNHMKGLWNDDMPDTESFKSILPLFRALSNKSVVQSLLEQAVMNTLLSGQADMRSLDTLFELLKTGKFLQLITTLLECGEHYIASMVAMKRECEDASVIPPHLANSVQVTSISARLYNTYRSTADKVIPSASAPYYPGHWRLPLQLGSVVQDCITQFAASYKRKLKDSDCHPFADRLVTFDLHEGSMVVTDTRFPERELVTTCGQFTLLSRFDKSNPRITLADVEEHLGVDGLLVLKSLAPYLVESDGFITLADTPPADFDFRQSWIDVKGGSPEPSAQQRGVLSNATQTAINQSVALFMDVGLDAQIMRLLKSRPCRFSEIKTSVTLHTESRLGGYVVPDDVLWDRIKRLEGRDFVTIDKELISMSD